MRFRELTESGLFWHQDDRKIEHDDTIKRTGTKRHRARVIKRGLRIYVHMRQKVAVLNYTRSSKEAERFITPNTSSTKTVARIPRSRLHHPQSAKSHYTKSRPRNEYPLHPRLRDVYRPVYLPAASEMEIWLIDLWKDFLLEPTPYLVISATFYLGIFMMSLQYYQTIWNIAYIFIQLIPWDEDFGATGHQLEYAL